MKFNFTKISLVLIMSITQITCSKTGDNPSENNYYTTDLQKLDLSNEVKKFYKISYHLDKNDKNSYTNIIEDYFIFNEAGNLIEEGIHVNAKNPNIKNKFHYDEKNLKILKEVFKKDVLINTTTYSYDENNRLVEEINLNSDNDTLQILVYEYEKDLLIKRATSNKTNQLQRYILYTYDKSNHLTKSEHFKATDDLLSQYLYIYNENDHLKEMTVFNSDGSIEEKFNYEYEFDAQGNWFRKEIYENGEVISFEERKIEYFE